MVMGDNSCARGSRLGMSKHLFVSVHLVSIPTAEGKMSDRITLELTRPLFCLFSFFLHDKNGTHLTKNDKSIDGV